MPRRVKLTRTITGPKGDVTVPRTDVWPLTTSTVGYVINRGGVATARYNNQYRSLRMPFTAKNKAAAVKAAEAWVLEQMTAGRPGGAPVTRDLAAGAAAVVTFMSAWREYEAARLNERGDARDRAKHRDAWRAFTHFARVDEALTDESARRITLAGIRLLTDGDGTPEHPPRSANTVLSYASRWRPFMRFCRAAGWITVEPLGLVRLPRPEVKASAVTYSDDDLARLDAHFAAMRDGNGRSAVGRSADAEGYRLLWRFLALSGCRIMEALNLAPEDLHETHIELRLTKRGRPRSIPLAPFPDLADLCRVLRERAITLGARRGRSAAQRQASAVKLFPTIDPDSCARQLTPALAALGIDGGDRPHHAFRATAIRRWEVMGIPEAVRDRLSGHSRSVAERHYNARKSADELVRMIVAAGVPVP